MTSLSKTPLSLLDRVRLGDEAAWCEFSELCLRMLRAWSARLGLQPADADDLIQDTLLIVIGRIRVFHRRGAGSFRKWLKVIAWRCWCDAIARAERAKRPQVLEYLKNSALARASLEEEFERLFEQQMLEQAFARVKARVQANTWESFRLLVLEGLRGEQVAELTGMHLNSVYMARCRVQRLVTLELQRLADAERPN